MQVIRFSNERSFLTSNLDGYDVAFYDGPISNISFIGSRMTLRTRAESSAVPVLKVAEQTLTNEFKVKPLLSIDHDMDIHLLYRKKHENEVLGVICVDNCFLRSGEILKNKTPAVEAFLAEEGTRMAREYDVNVSAEALMGFMVWGPFVEVSGDQTLIRKLEAALLRSNKPSLGPGINVPLEFGPMLHTPSTLRMYDVIARLGWAPKKDIDAMVRQIVASMKPQDM